MKIMEFENTQGITLQYPVANLMERIISFVLDFIILGIILSILSFLFGWLGGTVLSIVILAPVFIFYALAFELLNNGRSPGKMIMGLKVMRVDGRSVTPYDYLMRWMFRWIDIYMSFGSLASITVGATPRGQRVGDMLADTSVIRVRSMRVSIDRLMSLSNLSDYKPQFPQVVDLEEKQIVLIKESLDRYKKYRNAGHSDLLEELANRVAVALNVEKTDHPNQFLRTVIKDYVYLTR